MFALPDIILLTGNLDYTITLDPSAWLFDDRKFDLNQYFKEPHDLDNPPRKYKKRELLKEDYTFGVPLKPFLENASPKPEAEKLVIETKNGEHEMSIKEAKNAVLGFSKNGKFLNEDGPAHLYYGNGSNQDNPITDITKIIVR
ncbi:MAG TPA: peptidyl-prolyl cis-trans isomerase [Bacillales bacterium]